MDEMKELDSIRIGDEVGSIQFVCGKCGRAVPYAPIPVKVINRGQIKEEIAQPNCANPECREESGLNYRADKEGDRVSKLERLCDALEQLRRYPRVTELQLLAMKTAMEDRNLRLRFTVKRISA